MVADYPGFQGHKASPFYKSGKYATVDAIIGMFTAVALNASASVVSGLDKVSLNAFLSNAIAPLKDQDVRDYNQSDNYLLFLVLGFNSSTGEVDGIGALNISWTLKIKDFKQKKTNLEHETELTIYSRSVVYDSLTPLFAQENWIKQRFPGFLLEGGIPIKYKFKIYSALPLVPTEELFLSSLPVAASGNILTALVFYGADLIALGSFSNRNSKASSTYSIATTSGFSFTMSQKIGSAIKMAAGVAFAKAELSFSFEVSFTEQWNTSRTETVAFQVPATADCFMYKGTLMTRYVYYDPSKFTYTYGDGGIFYTNYVVTSEKPLNGDPMYPS